MNIYRSSPVEVAYGREEAGAALAADTNALATHQTFEDVSCPLWSLDNCESPRGCELISSAGGSGRAAEPSRLRSRPAAWFSRTASGVFPP